VVVQDKDIRLVTVASYRTPWDAHNAKGRLEAEGLTAFVEDQHTSLFPTMDATGSVKVRVPADQATVAAEILARRPAASSSSEDETVKASNLHRRVALVVILIIVLVTVWKWAG